MATSPSPGAGITFSWEILDKRGSAAVLSATTGQIVTIGPNTAIGALCGFLVELTVDDNGTITKSRRMCSVRSTNAGLRPAMFPETAPEAQKLSLNDPDLSTDNALYTDRSGLGVAEQNPFGWSEWAWEIVNAIEAGASGGGSPTGPASGDLSLSYPGPRVSGFYNVALDVTAASPSANQALIFDGTNYKPTTVLTRLTYRFVVGNALEGDTLAICDFLDPGDGTGLEAAIAACDGVGSIFVRRGLYDLVTGGVVTPIAIPGSIAVHGAGVSLTTFRARMTPGVGESMSVFNISGSEAELADCTILVDAPGSTNAGAETYFVNLVSGARARRVDINFATIIGGQWADFGTIDSAFQFAAGAVLEECRTLDAVSYLDSGGPDPFICFDGIGTFDRNPFRLVRCAALSPSGTLSRGGDVGFRTNFGIGYLEHCVATNVRLYPFQLRGSAEGVKIIEPEISWTAADSVGRYAVLFGDPTAGSTSVIDNEILGGRADIGTAGPPTPAVAVYAGAGVASRNKAHGITLRGWDTGFYVDASTGTAEANSMQLCTLESIATNLDLVNAPVNTVFDNNVLTGAVWSHEVMNGPLNASQIGTTALYVGSVKLASNRRILATSAAMLGGSIPSETATLELRRFTGGAVIATWSVTAVLGDVQLAADVTIPADDWYDFYLYAGGAAETALVKGVTLLTVQE